MQLALRRRRKQSIACGGRARDQLHVIDEPGPVKQQVVANTERHNRDQNGPSEYGVGHQAPPGYSFIPAKLLRTDDHQVD